MEIEETTERTSLSFVAIVANNLLPLLGVIFLGWRAFEILVLYWVESVIFTFFVLLKMTKIVSVNRGQIDKFLKLVALSLAIYLPFLFAQYIAIIIFGAFSMELQSSGIRNGLLAPLWENPEMLVAVFSTLITYVISYRRDFIHSGAYKNDDLSTEFTAPVKRIMVIQFAVLLGGFIAIILARMFSFDLNVNKGIMVGMLLLVKNIADVKYYRKSK